MLKVVLTFGLSLNVENHKSIFGKHTKRRQVKTCLLAFYTSFQLPSENFAGSAIEYGI